MLLLPCESHISMSQESGVCSLDPLNQSLRCGSATWEFHNTSMNCCTLLWMLESVVWIVMSPVGWAGVFVDHAMKVQFLTGKSFHFVASNCSPRVAAVWNRKGHTNGIQSRIVMILEKVWNKCNRISWRSRCRRLIVSWPWLNRRRRNDPRRGEFQPSNA